MGSSELIPSSALLARAAFALPIKLFLSHFYPSDPLPHPTVRERASSCVRLSCLPAVTHNTL